ncbi:DUF4411 family protein [Candidatus Saccharibacteria bacterium TM7i]|nr:DUF4411 family protein [Candidatus Saccharibacteria bacterium TM7i]
MSSITPLYCVDTNTLVSFLKESDDELYGRDVFAPQWEMIESLIETGLIIAPKNVKLELDKWKASSPEVKEWLSAHTYMFVDIDDQQLVSSRTILGKYEAYSKNENYANDLSVIALAHSANLTVITLEQLAATHAATKPKIPNVCQDFGVNCVSVSGFLRLEKIRQTTEPAIAVQESSIPLA